MSRKTVSVLMPLLLVVSMFTFAFEIQTVQADGGTIYINADGSMSPSSAPIGTEDNVTYTLTGNITAVTYGIVIERDNIVFDGAGYTLQENGSESGTGLSLTSANNVTIKNMEIMYFSSGIVFKNSKGDVISGNKITDNNVYGIYLQDSSSDASILGNNVTGNYRGIILDSSGNDSIVGNTIANSDRGIDIYSSNNISISKNDIHANGGTGIHIESSSNSSIFGNTITNNSYGIALEYSCIGNSVFRNILTNNVAGIYIEYSSGNRFYCNNFMNNSNQVRSYNSANTWDNGSMGNHWSDYPTKYPKATETNGSIVWNIPYIIDTNNTDHYPLVASYGALNPEPQQQYWLFRPEILASIIGSVGLLLVITGVVLVRRKRK